MAPHAQAQVPAFPGATGPGAIATGGRGGDVYHVTNLNPDKAGTVPGSLMYGVKNTPSAGRTIVFDVGGTIYLAGGATNDDTLRFNWGKITIAGQTAPGPGITIAGTGTKWTGDNVILRNIAVRPNKSSKPDTVTYDSFSLQVKNSIVDHVSATWFTDEGISITDAAENSTVQYANISEGLHYGGHAFGSIISTERDGTKYSYNHNLYAHLATRQPAVGSETGANGATTEFANNVIYNWSATKTGYGSEKQNSNNNFIGNYYINGANQAATNLLVADTSTKLYQSGNMIDKDRNATINGTVIPSGSAGSAYFRSGDSSAPVTYVSTAFDVTGAGPNTRETADVALQRVLDYGGANWQNRSPIDARLFNSVRNVSGRNINDLSTGTQAGEWATLMAQRPDANGNALFTRAANFDTDKDGIPDVYEKAHGTNPNAANNNADFDSDGYTDLEEYVNDLGAWPAANTLVFSNANGRFAQIANWGNLFQPSRFDTAHVNAGTATVDAAGQHARILSIATNAGNTAELKVTGGWIDVVQTLAVGPAGNATVTQTGGTVRAGTQVILGGTGTGRYALSGGTLSTPLLTKGGPGGAFDFNGGVLHADRIAFDLINNGGTIAPGSDAELQAILAAAMPNADGSLPAVQSAIGNTRVNGNLTLASGTLQLQFAGPTDFDTILVDNVLTLGGTLDIQLAAGYVPAPGDRFLIAMASEITGTFASITPGFSVEHTGSNLILVAVPEPASLIVFPLIAGAGLLRRRSPKGA